MLWERIKLKEWDGGKQIDYDEILVRVNVNGGRKGKIKSDTFIS